MVVRLLTPVEELTKKDSLRGRRVTLESILKNHLDSQPLQQASTQNLPQHHDNIRGPGYYH